MDKLKKGELRELLPPLPLVLPPALRMAGCFLLAWNPGSAAPSPFAVGYVCSLPREEAVFAAFGGFVGYLLTGSQAGAAFGCALALSMAVQLLTGWEEKMPLLGAVLCFFCGLLPREVILWRLVLTCALSGLLSQFLRLSVLGDHGLRQYSLTGKLCLLCLVLVVLRPLSLVGGLLTLSAGVALFGIRRGGGPELSRFRLPRLERTGREQAAPPVGEQSRPLRRAESALRQLRESLGRRDGEKSPESEAFLEGARQFCRRCPGQQRCWQQEGKETCADLQSLAPALARSHRLDPSDLPHRFATRCQDPVGYCAAVENCYRQALRRRVERDRDSRQRQLMARQLSGMQGLVARAARGQEANIRPLAHLERKARAVAAAYGADWPCRVWRQEGPLHLRLTLPAEGPLPDLGALERSLSLALGCRFRRPRLDMSPGGRELSFTQQERFSLALSRASLPRTGESVCGDSDLDFVTEEGRSLVLLSDGMGSGPAAHRLAETALSLLAAFVRAGCSLRESVDAVLPVLTLESRQDGFATLDLLEVDRFTGSASLIKYGAAPSYLLRGDKVQVLECASLPAGLDPEEPVQPLELTLRPGDRLLMVSDGITGPEGEEPEELLLRCRRESPAELLQAVMNRGDGSDDRTALLVTLREAPGEGPS